MNKFSTKRTEYTEFRKDGFPLCPVCGEDELWSKEDRPDLLTNEQLKSQVELNCYRCEFHNPKSDEEMTPDKCDHCKQTFKLGETIHTAGEHPFDEQLCEFCFDLYVKRVELENFNSIFD